LQTPQRTVLITGVTGFAGSYLADYLLNRGYRVIGATRSPLNDSRIEEYRISSLDRYTEWGPALSKADFVVHLAGRAHKMKDKPENQHLYFEINVDATVNLAQQAAAARVGKFVFASSVKAMGEGGAGVIYSEESGCFPEDAYGRSKLKAEMELQKISAENQMSAVILRPPLMYGPGVKGNMDSLIRLIKRLPVVPLGGLHNRRSFLALHNFSSAVEATLVSSEINRGVYLLSDGEAISTSELVNRMIKVFSPGCRNLELSEKFWRKMSILPFAGSKLKRLTGSLEVDSRAFCRELGWQPPVSMMEQFSEMAEVCR